MGDVMPRGDGAARGARTLMARATWHVAVWGGLVLVGLAAVEVPPVVTTVPPSFWIIAALVVLGELNPVRTSFRHDGEGTLTSTAFVFAILYLWGLWPALLLQAVVSMGAGRIKGAHPRRVLFRVGAGVLAIAAGWSVMALAELPAGLTDRDLELRGSDLLWVMPGWAVWFAVDVALVWAVSADRRTRLRQRLSSELRYRAATNAAVLALAPFVVVAAHESLWFLVVLLIPLAAMHRTARLSLEEKHKALHDALTGLPNRQYLFQTLDQASEERDSEPFALALLDLDRFKEVNDTLGHPVGDRLLEVVARRIREALRSDDVVARLGGDEFAIYLPGVGTADQAVDLAARIRDALVVPLRLEDVVLELEASIGIARYPDHGVEVDALMRFADVAMYHAKDSHTGVEVYDPGRDQHSADRLGLLAALRSAIDSDELELHYQPKVALGDSEVVGVEALLRWTLPSRGPVPPDEFIPLAEKSGLMHRLTAFVVDAALAQVARWREQGLDVQVAVNVSARDLDGPCLARTVADALARHGVPSRLLQLELTERTLVAEHRYVVDTLLALEALDVGISLDDFGTGYSSMIMLQRLPVSEIKVDRSFVSRLAEEGHDASIVRSIVELAHALGVEAVAEGVETEEVWRELAELGCDSAQGWYVSRPMSAAAATEWLREHVVAPARLRVAH